MNKVYIVYYDWANTRGNHAGMAYLARQLKADKPKQIKLIKHIFRFDLNYLGRKLYTIYAPIYSFFIALYLFLVLKSNDKVFFIEYCADLPGSEQFIARILRTLGVKNEFFGLIHQPESLLKLMFSSNELKNNIALVDKVIVFGSSLKKYLSTLKDENNIIQTYHYVDTNYYKPNDKKIENERLKVIIMGNQMRDDSLLYNIVESCPTVDFHICVGVKKNAGNINQLKNAFIHGFMTENNLLELMQVSDISLSVMQDTVGSNVIVTSIGCGLAMVVSDVGSIRDYCNTSNSILCTNTAESFSQAILTLVEDRSRYKLMKNKSIEISKLISLEKFSVETFPKMLDF